MNIQLGAAGEIVRFRKSGSTTTSSAICGQELRLGCGSTYTLDYSKTVPLIHRASGATCPETWDRCADLVHRTARKTNVMRRR